ncbi:MAG: hypothetical protein K1X66_01225 [Verrucomicrobiae bacterium]|nr:hypothetical protein [Verrucomicrobiae bacterium]
MEWSIQHFTSFSLQIDQVKIPTQLPIQLTAQKLFLTNPIDFPRPEAATLSQLNLVTAEKIWEQNQLQIAKISITLDELIIIKTPSAGINIIRLTALPSSSFAKSFIDIQTFEFFLPKIIYYDYTQSSNPQPITYTLDDQPHYFYHLHHFSEIPSHIARYALEKSSLNPSLP